MSLLSCAEFKAFAPDLESLTEAQMRLCIEGASAGVERYCGRLFASSPVTEYLSPRNHYVIQVARYPLTAVAEVRHDASLERLFGADTVLDPTHYTWDADKPDNRGELYCLRSPRGNAPSLPGWAYSGVRRRGHFGFPGLMGGAVPAWPAGIRTLKVTYTGGYTTIPADLKAAVAAVAAFIHRSTGSGGLMATSQSYVDASVSAGFVYEELARGKAPALGSARGTLELYRAVPAAGPVF